MGHVFVFALDLEMGTRWGMCLQNLALPSSVCIAPNSSTTSLHQWCDLALRWSWFLFIWPPEISNTVEKLEEEEETDEVRFRFHGL